MAKLARNRNVFHHQPTNLMKTNRRQFLSTAAAAGVASLLPTGSVLAAEREVTDTVLQQAAAQPVLRISQLKDPVIIESIQLLRKGRSYFVRVRSKDGAEGISVDDGRMDVLHPIVNRLVIPYFIGKDARDLEEHLFQVYRYRSNYKLLGLALWAPVALVEFAILDMFGRMTKKPMGELLGDIVRTTMPFYVASGRRDTTPEQEIEYLKTLVEPTGAKALKFRVGGRMSRNEDAMPGRTDKLIPLVRKVFGDKMVIHADANSSYDPPKAIEVGRMLEDVGAIHYEEPCPFDNFDDTKKVTDALKIPIAFGEQESSQWRFQWCIRNHVVDIVQPDLFYYGGMIRSRRVARMAEQADMATTVHLSGGFGFVYSLHFASCTPKIGPWQEYKKGVETFGKWFDPPLKIEDGAITVPRGPGVGIADPKELLKDAMLVEDNRGRTSG
ncbi:MAG TPA: mandelate racemase/muconate lactonizing enzyme family protein [Candidatus Angelobacter sp.]|nr:mandelate racemase/muconate lactonizing enzyme family protein [Candidatus Angelobacter sp.]